MTGDTESTRSGAQRRGLMLVISSPSGAGKTTLYRELMARNPSLTFSISVTTRKPRDGEVDGRDYHFRSPDEFKALRDTGQLLEWAEVHGNFYGTPRAQVMERLAAGCDLLFDLDWQGARQLSVTAPADIVRVFVLPPSAAALEQRLIGRKKDGAEVIERRLRAAPEEIRHWTEYDYVIVNDVIEASVARLEAILAAERARVSRQSGIADLVAAMLDELARRN